LLPGLPPGFSGASPTVIMPRRLMTIFDQTVVAGTILFSIPFLKSSAPGVCARVQGEVIRSDW
jgi:hypothetical protein